MVEWRDGFNSENGMNAQELITQARAQQRVALDEQAGKSLLAGYGVAVPQSLTVKHAGEVDAAFTKLRAPVVVKIMSPDILHKSDAGGVKVGLKSAVEVKDAINAMAASPQIKGARIDGYLVEEMAPAGQEIVVGGLRDPDFGPMVMVGLGGIFVEVLRDVSFRICPITRIDAQEMLDDLKGAAILDGARGRKAVSREAIIDVLLKVGGDNGLADATRGRYCRSGYQSANRVGKRCGGCRCTLCIGAKTMSNKPTAQDALQTFGPFFEPKTIAIIGASASGNALPNHVIRRMRDLGFQGDIYPIHPTAAEIDGLTAYKTLADTPKPIDYAYIAVPGGQIPAMFEAAKGRLRFAHVISSGFGEVDEGKDLQARLVASARIGGLRLVGPYCMGLFSPRGKVTFSEVGQRDVGTVGIISQSGRAGHGHYPPRFCARCQILRGGHGGQLR